MRAVFASRNPHKAEQVAVLLPDFELVPLADIAPDLELDEPFHTFEENALAKARRVAAATGLPAVADDSGVEADALGGEPGVRSARFAGENATDEDNNRKLIALLDKVPEEERSGRYRCVAALVLPDGREVVAEGQCAGTFVLGARGDLGFGYDPHFVPEGETRTMGEIPLEEKLRFSHRGRAFRALAEKIGLLETSERAESFRVERRKDSLSEEDVDRDPIAQFEAWLSEALEVEPGEPNAMTAATATRDGAPSVRTVLLRGFDDRGFTFFSNYGSRKGRDLDENPRAALLFYWGSLERQVVVRGRVEKLTAEESDRYFRSRPRGHQLGAWASAQSSVIDGRAELERGLTEVEQRFPADIPRPEHWGGFRVIPDAIEFWQGRPDRLHDRIRYRKEEKGAWLIERLAP